MKSLERVFWIVATVALGLYVLATVETRLYQVYLDWQFAERLQPPRVTFRDVPADAASLHAKPVEGQPIARIEISSIGLSAMVAEGVDNTTLRRAVGHIPGTALPGNLGNVGLSAHRDTFFRHLGKLKQSDQISVTTTEGTFDYIVESTAVVDPDESSVLRDIGRPVLTLVTCYPFYYVGPAPKRFVVHASLTSGVRPGSPLRR